MNLEIKMEVANGGYPVETVERYDVSITLDRAYKMFVFKTINGVVKYNIAHIEVLTENENEEATWQEVAVKDPAHSFVYDTVMNQLKKSGIAPPRKNDGN